MKLKLFIVVFSLLGINSYASNETAKLSILSTTDIHSYIMNYNYYQDKTDENVGVNKLASLIKQKQKQNSNTLLFDNGDLIQGSPLADYIINNVNLEKQKHPVIKIMEYLGYDAIGLGNHEFNYGLDKLEQIIAQTDIKILSNNVLKTDNSNKFTPHIVLNKKITTNKGNKVDLKVGVVSTVTPQIMLWDKGNLEGKVKTVDIVNAVNKSVAELKKQQVDLIVVLAHSGIGNYAKYKKGDENAVYELSKNKDINFIVTGHEHKVFPAFKDEKQAYADNKQVNNSKGTINNTYVVMPGSFAKYLGVFDVDLTYNNGKWLISNVNVGVEKPTSVDRNIDKMIATEHKKTISYINSKVGTINKPVDNYFARVNEDFSLDLVNKAQIWYAESLKSNTLLKYKNLPVIASMAPFKNGGRGGADFYTNIKAGNLSIKSVADLYLYPNTLMVLKINGKELREYLEWSAQNFNNISKTDKEQELINEEIPSYNYDVVDGVSYKIDLNINNRYKGDNIVNSKNYRVTSLKYNGKDVKDSDEFLFVTNNYRANTSAIVNKNNKNLVYDAQLENKEILIMYIKANKNIVNKIDGNFEIIFPQNTNLILQSSQKAKALLKNHKNIEHVKDGANGFATYRIKK